MVTIPVCMTHDIAQIRMPKTQNPRLYKPCFEIRGLTMRTLSDINSTSVECQIRVHNNRVASDG